MVEGDDGPVCRPGGARLDCGELRRGPEREAGFLVCGMKS